MARDQGDFPFSYNFERKKKATLDATTFVNSFADLLLFTAANFMFNGFEVKVWDADPELSGMYELIDEENLSIPESWRKTGALTVGEYVTGGLKFIGKNETTGKIEEAKIIKIIDKIPDYISGVTIQVLPATNNEERELSIFIKSEIPTDLRIRYLGNQNQDYFNTTSFQFNHTFLQGQAQIFTLKFSNPNAIKILNLPNKRINFLSAASFPLLEFFLVPFNFLGTFAYLENAPNLKYIDVSHNELTYSSNYNGYAQNFISLNASYNNIQNVSDHLIYFDSLSGIRYIDFSNQNNPTPLTPAGIIARNSLITKGWTVIL